MIAVARDISGRHVVNVRLGGVSEGVPDTLPLPPLVPPALCAANYTDGQQLVGQVGTGTQLHLSILMLLPYLVGSGGGAPEEPIRKLAVQ